MIIGFNAFSTAEDQIHFDKKIKNPFISSRFNFMRKSFEHIPFRLPI